MAAVDNLSDVSKLKISNDASKRSKRRRSSNYRLTEKPNVKVQAVKKDKKRKHLLPPSLNLKAPNKVVKIRDVRDFALYIYQLENRSPSFIDVTNRDQIEHVVLLLVPGLELQDFGLDWESLKFDSIELPKIPEELKFFQSNLNQAAITQAPDDNYSLYPLTNALINIPYNKKEKQRKTKELESKKVVIGDLLMKVEEFIDQNYPVHPLIEGVTEIEKTSPPLGWVDTVEFEHEGSHTFSIDCEMCETEAGKVLTRVSLIDFNEQVIMDELVKPKDEITNYLTQYSGITEDALKNVTTTLQDIQQKLLKIISVNDVLIGHSIENDLNVLQLRHPKIIDTSLVYEHPRGPPYKSSLKYLTKTYLNRTIQEGSHDSIIDAKACLDLVKTKIQTNALLGKVIDGQTIFNILEDSHKKAVVIDYMRVPKGNTKFVECSNDDEITDNVINKSTNSELVIAKLNEINLSQRDEANGIKSKDEIPKKEKLFQKLNERIEKIYSNLPGNSILIVSSGNGNTTQVHSLGQQKRNFKREYQNKLYSEIESKWDNDDESNLKNAMKKARTGLVFATLKTKSKSTPKEQNENEINEQVVINDENNEEAILETDES
ncbi:putative exonuclease [Wickerhamomyces ciferrii]|uniref:Exonuclease n=1 Tax=Wickerhamomyces ciferrii (strain ATCC 14091 / BCRC 22168 / CBS 111 / JCM 3599 / NBRC 0793 / NRRL Y-1031 F-60-10) TaxID=1206466 RepID=K0KNG9_WICCF|nr:putative exonuclease [Wickerhamomyces ciferrii]CCH46775.1 putative exonuclease [Wickerhamomyces ciferrii]